MKLKLLLLVCIGALVSASGAAAAGWNSSVVARNQVASSPVAGGGYPDVAGTNAPAPGTCRAGQYNSNRSESSVAVQPGTENLVGSSKFFFENYSTFYNFHLGAYSIPSGSPAGNVQIPGYDCVSNKTQNMPPDWTNDTDPNVAFDTQGRAYEVTLPFNAYWTNLHPNGAIGAVYSDNLGRSWTVGNHGNLIQLFNNSSTFAFGDVVDKQWVAVNDSAVSPYRDHVYAFWAVFNGNAVEVDFSKSTDRGDTFSAPVRITPPNQVGPSTTYVYPSVDASGTLYVAIASFAAASGSSDAEIYVGKSTDDGTTFTWFDTGQLAKGTPGCCFANTTFRDGILENFTSSQTYPGHLYLAYERWDGTQMDVEFSQSTDGGATWSVPATVSDALNSATTDQFQPSVAAGPNGAVAVAFYDRRASCPSDKSILAADAGRPNLCIDLSLQAYKDSGTGAVPVGANVRVSQYTWDPQQPAQTVGGLGQMACASHNDPCSVSFIGDYFGLAISDSNVYTLSVSTHYPSGVRADDGARVYYQQQVLGTIARSALGI
ncbi:MAG: sialidase family protein [Gaiellaceae bacterium]